MQQQTKNLLAAAVAGVILGAFATAVLMSNNMRRAGTADMVRPGPGVDPDDVVAVLDAENELAPHSKSRPAASGPPSVVRSPEAPGPIDPSVPTLSAGLTDIVDDLRARRLTLPVQGVDSSKLVQSFEDRRSGARRHEAIDILAPRNTAVMAVEDGTVARLFMSRAGGITIYQYDPGERFVYYYAHLERYADGLTEGAPVRRGQVIGFVGTSGNAPPGTPHLHFAIFRTTGQRRWWEGIPVDPFLVLR